MLKLRRFSGRLVFLYLNLNHSTLTPHGFCHEGNPSRT